MPLKWIALWMVMGGGMLLLAALCHVDAVRSFSSDSFLYTVLTGIAGALGLVVGIVLMLVAIFLAI